ncbi:MAG: hypothetical protein IKP22_14685 [Clostridia bacterium]|nr:hypothetical protein [Clostridia bacterium]
MFTDGYGAHNTADPETFFHADDSSCCVLPKGGEAWLAPCMEVSSWEQLAAALSRGGRIGLSEDIAASEDDSSELTVPSEVTAELDLKGHTLDGSRLRVNNGHAYLIIYGSFTLTDNVGHGVVRGDDDILVDGILVQNGASFTMNGGTITGGGSLLEDLVAVSTGGFFTMNGGAIRCDMTAAKKGIACVYVCQYASFVINGGTIGGAGSRGDIILDDANTSVSLKGGSLTGSQLRYGNVYFNDSAGMTVGRLAVEGSVSVSVGIYPDQGRTITVTGPLGVNASIPVITEVRPIPGSPVVITDGLERGGENALSRFSVTSDDYYLALDDSGGAELRKKPTEWDEMQQLIDAAKNGGVLTLTRDYTAVENDRHLCLEGSKRLTIDLNGHTLDGTAMTDGDVVWVKDRASLTLRDSGSGGIILGQGGSSVVAVISKGAGEKVKILENTTATAVWYDLPIVTVRGVTGSFNDRIKLNFYFDIPDSVLADEGAYVTLTNENTEKVTTVNVEDAEFVPENG